MLVHESAFCAMALYILSKWGGFNTSFKGQCLGHQVVGLRAVLHAFGVGPSKGEEPLSEKEGEKKRKQKERSREKLSVHRCL